MDLVLASEKRRLRTDVGPRSPRPRFLRLQRRFLYGAACSSSAARYTRRRDAEVLLDYGEDELLPDCLAENGVSLAPSRLARSSNRDDALDLEAALSDEDQDKAHDTYTSHEIDDADAADDGIEYKCFKPIRGREATEAEREGEGADAGREVERVAGNVARAVLREVEPGAHLEGWKVSERLFEDDQNERFDHSVSRML